ncbi:hypothetical protein ACHAPJ_005041 [Fusarium lateritium]
MSRYGWSIGREQISPYSSMPSGVPAVTDDDFSYITSQDLDGVTEDRYYPRSYSTAPPPAPEDDVLLIKNRGITYPAHFPAYAIGDGKLRVIDVKDRVGLMMELPERGTSRIKLLYKGKQLKDPMAPVRDYGVKNNSELMAVMPEIDDVSSGSEEEMVIVDAPREDRKTRRRKNKRDKKKKGITSDGDSLSASSPRDSASTFDHPRSPPAPPTSSGATSGPMKVLDDLAVELQIKWLPLCTDYIESPPSDPKKREEEHRKLSESIMMHIMLKLDGVEAEGMPEVRARRKELVRQVQKALKDLDTAKES